MGDREGITDGWTQRPLSTIKVQSESLNSETAQRETLLTEQPPVHFTMGLLKAKNTFKKKKNPGSQLQGEVKQASSLTEANSVQSAGAVQPSVSRTSWYFLTTWVGWEDKRGGGSVLG